MPVEKLCMREFTGNSLPYPLVVRKDPYFLKGNDIIRRVDKLMSNSFYPLFKALRHVFEPPVRDSVKVF